MSWTYSGDPSDSALDMVRFLVGDTDTSDQQLTNEEIAALLVAVGDEPYTAAIQAVEGLIAKYSRRVDKSVGDLSISYGQTAKGYQSLLSSIRRRASISLIAPYAGGISIADKAANEDNSDRVRPAFRRGMHNYDGTQVEQSDEVD